MTPPQWNYEGTWEEIRARDAELTGLRVCLTILKGKPSMVSGTLKRPPNETMLAAMREADAVQQGMNPKVGTDSVVLVREARSGSTSFCLSQD